jgi:DNA polymerase-3 subunit delta'
MDIQQEAQSITSAASCPAQLWLGTGTELIEQAHTYMQQRWCHNGGCKRCTICSLIEQHQYHSMLWIEPQGNYTRETLDVIFDTIQYALDENREMIIVLNHADYLTASCYNSLLKSIEEPPRGYHFLFLAERIDAVASTIRSRCVITHFSHTDTDITQHRIAKFFLYHQYENPTSFIQALEFDTPDEHETAELIDHLLQYWIHQYKKATLEQDKAMIDSTAHIITILQHTLEEPPMAGSSKLFWKNLFVQIRE